MTCKQLVGNSYNIMLCNEWIILSTLSLTKEISPLRRDLILRKTGKESK
jgi:hypothetical protein